MLRCFLFDFGILVRKELGLVMEGIVYIESLVRNMFVVIKCVCLNFVLMESFFFMVIGF